MLLFSPDVPVVADCPSTPDTRYDGSFKRFAAAEICVRTAVTVRRFSTSIWIFDIMHYLGTMNHYHGELRPQFPRSHFTALSRSSMDPDRNGEPQRLAVDDGISICADHIATSGS